MRVKVGDIIEISTSHGLAYAQLAHRDKLYGELVRVLPERLPNRPTDFSRLVSQPDRLQVFVHVPSVLKRRLGELVGHADVPEFARTFPVFRFRQEGAGPADWFLWDGEQYQRLGRCLPREHRSRPNLAALGPEYFVDLVERNAVNEDMPELCAAAPVELC